MQIVKKISAATVFGGKSEILETVFRDKSKNHPLYRVVGKCNGSRTGAGKEGMNDWVAMLGSFQATNAITGEVFRAGACFLPQFAADLVLGQLGGDVDSVKFAFDIGAQHDERSATSYIYTAVPLMEPSEDDELNAMENNLPRLGAPSAVKQLSDG